MNTPTTVPPDAATRTPRWALLADGSSVRIRMTDAADREALTRLHAGASDESIYRRFFSVSRTSAEAYVDVICGTDPGVWSLVAVRDDGLVGVATASLTNAAEAEVAFLVDEQRHGVGIGTILLEQLAAWGRELGLRTFVADVLTENLPMLRVFHEVGFEIQEDFDHGVVTLEMDLTISNSAVSAADRRERVAESRSLKPLFEPASVAVLGVSHSRGSIGREVVENILAGGYTGRLYALSREDLGLPGVNHVARVEDLPRGLDLVVVAMPGAVTEHAVGQMARLGARTCVVLTAGLGETGAAGWAAEQRMAAAARGHGMRLVGPNCFGIVSNLRGMRLDATFGTIRPRPGRLAVASQSGGVGIALVAASEARGTGLAGFVSLGNKAEVSGNDLLAAWADDPDIDAVALYLESFHNPRKFARLAATCSRSKPILAVFGGRSPAGTRAGSSHTAASATPGHAVEALFRASGVVAVDSVEELVDTAALLTEQSLPRGRRLGVIGNAGGLGIIAADTAATNGLVVPELSAATQEAVRLAVRMVSGPSNPVDLGAGASPDAFGQSMKVLLGCGEIDSLLVVAAATAVTDLVGIREAVEDAAEQAPDLPRLSVMIGGEAPHPTPSTTAFSSSEAAIRALGHAVSYSEWRRGAAGTVVEPVDEARITPTPGDGDATMTSHWLEPAAAQRLLAEANVFTADWCQVSGDEEAVAATRRLHYPLVAKTADPTIVHKSDTKLVRTGLSDRRAVVGAVAALQRATAGSPVLIQEQLSGPELAVGVVRDARFGPLVMVASGGVALDLWADQTFLMPPITDQDALAALGSLRSWPMMTGFRGGAELDVDAVVELVCAIGTLALEHPEILEVDLNPVMVTTDGPRCVDAKVRVRD